MKRELVFALGYQSQLAASSLTRAPVQSQTGLTHSNGGFDSDDVSQNKRLKVSTLKVYSRRVKLNNGNSETPKSEEKTSPIHEQEIVVASSPIEVQPNGTLRSSTPEEEVENDQNVLVEVVVQEDFNNICRKPAFREARRRRIYSDGELVDVVIQEDAECKSSSFICKEGRENFENAVGNGVYCDEGSGLNNGSLPELVQRRFTRPFFASEVQEDEEERAMENVVSEPENVARLSISSLDGDAARGVNELATPSKMDWKMSKKIAFNKKIMTVRDLFETGLLDGVTVVYMGGLTKVSGLRGTIQDGGILCSCSLCNGLRVLPPSQFEIHACKVYRRAAQYICLENGKSLLDVLKACRSAPAYMLEDTIQRIINTLPVEKTFNCRGCKNTFPAPTMPLTIRGGPLCSICIELKKSQSPSVPSSSKIARSAKAVATLEASPVMKISVHDSSEPRIKSQPLYTQLISNSKFPEIDSAYPKRNLSEKTTKSARSILPSKSCRSVPAYILKQKKSRLKKLKKSSKLGSKLKFAKFASASASSQKKKSQWKITIKDQRLHRLVFENDGLPDGTEVAYYSRGEKILEGYKKGFGIFCRCCNTEVSPSQFEAHAGWASRKKPYSNIYISNGVSLHELAISLSRGRKYSAKDNDNLCTICADGGNLLLCDGCPRAFHRECASLTSIPRGDWYCHYCQNLLQKEKFVNENALAAGRVSGVDPIEEITKRCIRIVKNIAVEVSGCALCGGYDFSKAGFGPRTIILCDQCEQEFHIGCLRERKMANLKELPKGKWFCCGDCNQIYSTLQSLLVCGPEKLNNSVLSIIKKKHEEKGLDTSGDLDVSWRLLSGSFASPESRRLLSEAVSIFHECFDPIVDWMTGRDLIPAMVYGRSTRRQEYGGMYCAVLIINSVVVSAGILRVFGKEIAELPLVATRKDSHDKGYFQLLFSCIEKLLTLMNVRSLVLPAAAEAESIWIDKFGFKRIDPEELMRFRKTGCQMLTFQGTSMLKKPVSELTVTKSES